MCANGYIWPNLWKIMSIYKSLGSLDYEEYFDIKISKIGQLAIKLWPKQRDIHNFLHIFPYFGHNFMAINPIFKIFIKNVP